MCVCFSFTLFVYALFDECVCLQFLPTCNVSNTGPHVRMHHQSYDFSQHKLFALNYKKIRMWSLNYYHHWSLDCCCMHVNMWWNGICRCITLFSLYQFSYKSSRLLLVSVFLYIGSALLFFFGFIYVCLLYICICIACVLATHYVQTIFLLLSSCLKSYILPLIMSTIAYTWLYVCMCVCVFSH